MLQFQKVLLARVTLLLKVPKFDLGYVYKNFISHEIIVSLDGNILYIWVSDFDLGCVYSTRCL